MGAAVRSAALAAPPPPRFSLRALAWIALAELLLVLVGWKLESFVWPLVGALGIVYALVAYRAPEAAWLLVWIAIPFSREVLTPLGAAFSVPTEPMMAIALAVWSFKRWPWRDLSFGPRSIAKPLAVVAALALFSVALSHFPVAGLKAWVMAALYAAFGYFYFVSTGSDARRLKRWLAAGVVLASALSIYASVRVLASNVAFHVAYGAARPFFLEHGTFAAYLAFFLPPAIVESLSKERGARWLWALGAGVILAGIVLSFTRAAWLSVVVVVPFLLAVWTVGRGGAARLWLPLSIVGIVALGIGWSKLSDPLSRHARSIVTPENVSNLERLNRWMAAVEMTRARPLTGVGYGVYPEEYREFRRKSIVTEQSLVVFGVHNELLRMLAETGWPGLAASLWFVAAVAAAGLRAFARDPGSDRGRLALGLTCGLATYGVHGLFNSYLGIDKISVPFWIFIGMVAALAMAPPHLVAVRDDDVRLTKDSP